MSTLERAVAIAATAHEGQRDKADAPYILHPLRVMLRLTSEAERITAVLHDVVEDCEGWSFERLLGEGFSNEIIEALQSEVKRLNTENDELRAENNTMRAQIASLERRKGARGDW